MLRFQRMTFQKFDYKTQSITGEASTLSRVRSTVSQFERQEYMTVNTFSRFAQRYLRAAFPSLPDRTHFLRQEHVCVSLIEQVGCLLAEQRADASDERSILDATGVPVRHLTR